MYKCLIWGNGKVFYDNINQLKALEYRKQILVIGVTGKIRTRNTYYGYNFIENKDLNSNEFDLVIIMSDKFYDEIESEAKELGIDSSKVITYRALNVPFLKMDKYLQLKEKPISIFSLNCWGGITYHKLGLRFESPFINMFLEPYDYISFLEEPQKYIELDIKLEYIKYNEELDINYPVCRCGDILLYFNHYDSYDKAKKTWDLRKKRINWENLFVLFYSNDENLINRFTKLNYNKKICFTQIEYENEFVYTIDFCKQDELRDKPLYTIVLGMAWGQYFIYDAIELLLTGKIITVDSINLNYSSETV